MEKTLSDVLSKIKDRLLAPDISEFKIGITGDEVEKRYWNGYNAEQYTHISEIAAGDTKAVANAEKYLIAWANDDKNLNCKCKNTAAGGNGNIENADKVYIVAKSSHVKFNNVSNATKMNDLWENELLPKKLLPNFTPINLQNQ